MLPAASHTRTALFNDPDYAWEVAKASLEADEDEETDPWAPALNDWNFTNELLVQVIDLLNNLSYITAAAQGAKGLKKPKNYPRPRTAIDKAKDEMARAQGNSLYEVFGLKTPDWDVKVTPVKDN